MLFLFVSVDMEQRIETIETNINEVKTRLAVVESNIREIHEEIVVIKNYIT